MGGTLLRFPEIWPMYQDQRHVVDHVEEDDLGIHVVLSKFKVAAHLSEEVHMVISGFREKLMSFEMFQLSKLEGVSVQLAVSSAGL